MSNIVFRPAILIPVYNHEEAIALVLERVLAFGSPVLMVDDGSQTSCQQTLEGLQQQYSDRVFLLRLPENKGKGAAVKAGMFWLHARQFTHALQLDADGQHAVEDIAHFLAVSQSNPQKLIAGYPQYDASVPKLRFYARYLTHVWIWINTLSFSIIDSMCGFRVYPLDNAVKLLTANPCGNRMDFDSEIIVRWVWCGWDVVNLATKVHYPIDGISHFKLWRDNALITNMHTRMFFGMLWRLPKLLWRKIKVAYS
jgi:glycosyltransferase involved in cell wall biosynthesis